MGLLFLFRYGYETSHQTSNNHMTFFLFTNYFFLICFHWANKEAMWIADQYTWQKSIRWEFVWGCTLERSRINWRHMWKREEWGMREREKRSEKERDWFLRISLKTSSWERNQQGPPSKTSKDSECSSLSPLFYSGLLGPEWDPPTWWTISHIQTINLHITS